MDADYVYTDAYGDKHGFKDTYYYIDSLGKKRSISKTSVTVEPDGNLFYIPASSVKYEVKKEQRTETGLTAITKIEGFKGAEWVELRSDELKQIENQIDSIKAVLDTYVKFEPRCITDNGNKLGDLSNYLNLNLSEMNSILEPIEYDTEEKYKAFRNYNKNKELIASNSQATAYLDLVLQKDVLQAVSIPSANGNTDIEDLYKSQAKLVTWKGHLTTGEQSDNAEQLDKYYKEYTNLVHKREKMLRQLPVNYITDAEKSIMKGFNEDGDLVAIFDKYENMMTIEYDEVGKIVAVYDGEDKQIVFDYLPNGLLGSITDTRGRKTNYTYTNSLLTGISFANGKSITLGYEGDYLTAVISSDKMQTELSYTRNTLQTVATKSTVTAIRHNSPSTTENEVVMETISFDFGDNLTTITEDNGNKKYYKVDDDGNVYEYYEEQNNLIVKAEKYDYVPGNENTIGKDDVYTSLPSLLYKKSYAEFVPNFENGDSVKTELDEFNNPKTKTTNARPLSDGTTQQVSVSYEYDDNHKCIKETAVVTIKEGTSVLDTYTQVTAYNYNASGNVVRKESYIEGEELTTGKSIEETVYDEKGNAVKSFSYNSLDSSSKFYTESEVAENGQTVADYDETGENKTEYEYISGTNVVREEKLPNGSKFAYGHDESDAVTSITQSTEEGEENSTQTRYTCGEVTELVSGNNVVRYAYDEKRRVTQVYLNDLESAYIQNTYTDGTTLNGVTVDACASKNANGETITSYTDKQGRVRRITTPSGKNIDYAYNAKGETTSVVDGVSGKTEIYTYNETYDRLTGYTRKAGETSEYTEAYAYDEYGKVKSVTQSGAAARTYTYAYNAVRELESITTGAYKFSPQTDKLGRNAGREVWKDNAKLAAEYIYYRKVGDHATNMPSAVYFGKKKGDILSISENIKYAYDKMGNICRIDENGEPVVWYKYDTLNRLVREDNKTFGKTWLYGYDNKGNILCKRTTNFTLKENAEECEFESVQYEYDGDKLLSYGTETCEYDDIGNPETYRGKSVGWSNGRQMVSYNGTAFTYDGLGKRLSKGNITYTYDGNNRVIKQSNGLEFFYDNTGVAGIEYNNATYLYQKDAQGNICKILDSNGSIIVQYKYDAWGNHAVLDVNGADIEDKAHIGNMNPFRYRGYYYDTETGLYYLKSRYYDPEVCRFITIDDIAYLDPETVNGLNLYAYCGNNPMMRVDREGTSWWDDLWKGLLAVAIAIVVVAVVVAVTVATGGAAAPVLIGAAIGFGVSVGVSALTQYAQTGTINIGQVLLAGAIGGVLGAFGGSAIGQLGMAGVTFGVEFVGSLASDWIAGVDLNFKEAFTTAFFSSAFSFMGGAGAQKDILPIRRQALSTKQAIINRYAAGGYSLAGFKGGLSSNARRLAKLSRDAINNLLKGTGLNIFSSFLMGLL